MSDFDDSYHYKGALVVSEIVETYYNSLILEDGFAGAFFTAITAKNLGSVGNRYQIHPEFFMNSIVCNYLRISLIITLLFMGMGKKPCV